MTLKQPMRILPLILLATLAGCSSMDDTEVLPDRAVEYKKSRNVDRNLEVPPDLTKSVNDAYVLPEVEPAGTTTYSEYASRERGMRQQGGHSEGAVLPQIATVDLMRDGDKRWLVAKAPPEQVWPKVVAFWRDAGILLVEQDAAIGVMVTDWVENRANIKTDVITDTLRGAFDGLYSSSTRDQYRVRLERGRDGTTEIYMTMRGMAQKGSTGLNRETEQIVWVPRDTEPGVEAEMLRRLMVYMGVSDQRAQAELAASGGASAAAARSEMVKGQGKVSLKVMEDRSRTWRLIGVALDRVGFAVEDRNQSEGVYFVRYDDPMARQKDPGLLSKLAFWSSPDVDPQVRYQVALQPDGASTRVVVRTEKGEELNNATAERILTLLHEQLK